MDINSLLNKFNHLVADTFDKFLASKEFKLESCRKEPNFYSRVYRKNSQYIKIGANINPKDYPHFWNVSLGEGTIEMPEADWNKITLWYLMMLLENPSAKEFLLNDSGIDKLSENIKQAKEHLEQYGKSFLEGDLKLFYQVRSLVNQKREPYKIYSKDKDGNLIVEDDEVSKKLKEKFS